MADHTTYSLCSIHHTTALNETTSICLTSVLYGHRDTHHSVIIKGFIKNPSKTINSPNKPKRLLAAKMVCVITDKLKSYQYFYSAI